MEYCRIRIFLRWILISISLLSLAIGYSQIRKAEGSLIVRIDFQKGFKSEKVDILINDCMVVTNVVLNTNPILDYTGFNIIIYSPDEIKLNQNKISLCEYVKIYDNNIFLKIKSSKSTWEKKISIAKGKYIGISRNLFGRVKVDQRKTSFFYD